MLGPGGITVVSVTTDESFPGWSQLWFAKEDGTTVTLSPSATGGQVQAGGGVAANGTGTIAMNALRE